jgi:hypothetical protein
MLACSLLNLLPLLLLSLMPLLGHTGSMHAWMQCRSCCQLCSSCVPHTHTHTDTHLGPPACLYHQVFCMVDACYVPQV